MKKDDWSTRTIKTPEGVKITIFDNKFHSWDTAAIRYPKSLKKKDEYYLYGISRTKEEWIEFRQDRNGVAPDKNSQVTSRF